MAAPKAAAIESVIYFLEDASALGGVQKHVADAASEMKRRGYEVSIVSRFHSANQLVDGIPTQSLYPQGFQDLVRAEESAEKKEHLTRHRDHARHELQEIFGSLNRNTVVIAVQYGCLVELEHSNLLETSARNFYLIGAYHSSWLYAEQAGYRTLLERLLNECDMAVFLTEEDRQKFQKDGVQNSFSIPNAISGGDSLALKERQAKCTYVGRLHSEKGVDELVHVWGDSLEADSPLPPLWIYGEGPQEDELREIITDRQLDGHVFLGGFTNRAQEIMRESMVVVSCSPQEGFPMMLLEAGSVGTPSVVYDAGPGTRELVEERGAGSIIPVGNRPLFADAVRQLFDCAELWTQKSEAASDASLEYSPEAIYSKWEMLFRAASGKGILTNSEFSEDNAFMPAPKHASVDPKFEIPVWSGTSTASLHFVFNRALSAKAFVATFRFWDHNGEEIQEPVEGLTFSDSLNALYVYVPDLDLYGPTTPMSFPLSMPAATQRIEVELKKWEMASDPRRFISGVFMSHASENSSAYFKLKESE